MFTDTFYVHASASSKMTLSQLMEKFPDGKYWNHVGSSKNNPDGYTDTPCTHHGNCTKNGTDYSGWCGCNSFASTIQCYGFANKLAYDAYGSLYTSWNKSTLNNLKAGDVIRYKNDNHSIFVIKVSGETITYGECNSDRHCTIRWGLTISKSTVKSTLTAVYSAPSELLVDVVFNNDLNGAGEYKVTTGSLPLNVRNGPGVNYIKIGSIPNGTRIQVSEINGSWGYISYNGINGYCSMNYLKKVNVPISYEKITDDNNNADTQKDFLKNRLMGDIDDDGKITSADSLLILRQSVGLEYFTDFQQKLADVDGDGKITSADALEVLRYSVGLPTNGNTGEVLN